MTTDCDMHVIEPNEVWEQVPEEDRPHFNGLIGEVDRKLFPKILLPEHRRWLYSQPYREEKIDYKSALVTDRAIIIPTRAMFVVDSSVDSSVSKLLVSAYNDWVAREFRGRFIPAMLLPSRPADAVAEITRMGFIARAFVLRPSAVWFEMLLEAAWDEVWSMIEALNVPLLIHEITGADATLRELRNNPHVMRAVTHMHLGVQSVTVFCAMGILERHPRLRVAFLECGTHWIPGLLDNLDKSGAHATKAFVEQCFVTVDGAEKSQVHPDCLLFGSDFPHFEGDGTAIQGQAVLETNPTRLLHG